MLHIAAVINRLPPAARHRHDGWDFICLGSDYDGLIASIIAARTAENLADLKKELTQYWPKSEKAYRQEFAGTPAFLADNLEQVLDKIFYSNGEAFVKKGWGIV